MAVGRGVGEVFPEDEADSNMKNDFQRGDESSL